MSPFTAPPAATSLSSRRIILPLRVLGSASLNRISSGLASEPISLATQARNSSFNSAEGALPALSVTKAAMA